MTSFIEYKGFDHAFKYWGPWVWYLIALYFSLPVVVYIILPFFSTNYSTQSRRRRIIIMVLGDIGHSPRMCYHAKSFSQLNYTVDLCGYSETEASTDISEDINIDIHEIKVIKNERKLPFIVFAVYKVVIQCFNIFMLLHQLRGAQYIMIQNPPSMPLLFITISFIKVFNRSTKLIIDWHNLNYTILNLKFKNLDHFLVRLLKSYESYFGKFAALNITVTNNMKSFLTKEFGINNKIRTLHDRPAIQFQPCTVASKAELLTSHEIFKDVGDLEKYKILVSSTSFTEDEDFSILLKALKLYEFRKLSQAGTFSLPPLLLIVTGKGPMKQNFLDMVKELKFTDSIRIKTAWLASKDYPKILSVADLGVSLHTSSSGIDLPMKIVDMFGCGLPVITLSFDAIGELVHHMDNGIVTEGSEEMYLAFVNVFSDSKLYNNIKKGAMIESTKRWDENWDRSLGKIFRYK